LFGPGFTLNGLTFEQIEYFHNACFSQDVSRIYDNALSTSIGSGIAAKSTDADLRKRGRILSDSLVDQIRLDNKREQNG
jgi:hypothetical protein